MNTTNTPLPKKRYHGFDLLRGLCALFVCIYHLCLWQEIKNFHLVGNYSVYIFFILSGASMTIAYTDKLANGMDFGVFLGRRFFRLAPLYWLIMLTRGSIGSHLTQVFLNLTFLFGFANPAINSRVIGGWSLGIEFIFYLLFPVFLLCLRGKKTPYLLLATAILIQQLYINDVIRVEDDLTKKVIPYTQFIAFFAYFLGGCLIGKILMRHEKSPFPNFLTWILFLITLLGLEFAASLSTDIGVTGVSGICFTLSSMLCVWLAGYLRFTNPIESLAKFCGKISYGLYLLHPILFFQITKHTQLSLAIGTPAFTVLIIFSAIILSFLLEKYFEKPIMNYGYQRLNKQQRT